MIIQIKKFKYITFAFLIVANHIQSQEFQNYTERLMDLELSFNMIAIEGGSFIMGTNSADRPKHEKPEHKVIVDDFWMASHEITWKQYEAFVYGDFGSNQFIGKNNLEALGIDALSGATPTYVDMSFNMGKGDHPAVNMTQYGAIMFCKWLTAKSGIFYRLPTEAEWEFACKKGNTDDLKNLNNIAWFADNSDNKYQKAGQKEPNDLDIYDLLGNVSEWVYDQFSTDYYSESPKSNPLNIPTTLYPRVLRGGSWKDTASKMCCTSRQASQQNWKQRDPQIPKSNWWLTDAPFVGFRIIRPKEQPPKEEIKKYWLEAIEDFGM